MKQRAAVAWIQELGGRVYFDHELDDNDLQISPARAAAPKWLLKIADEEFFRTVVTVDLTAGSSLSFVPFKRRGRADGSHMVDDNELKEGIMRLPKLRYLRLGGQKGITNDSIGGILRLVELESLEVSGTSIDEKGLLELAELPKLERFVTSMGTVQMKNGPNVRVMKQQLDELFESSDE